MQKYSSGAGKFTKIIVDLLLARPRQNLSRKIFSRFLLFSGKNKNLQIFSGDGPGVCHSPEKCVPRGTIRRR
jgi:hypothetical protein